jgi:hypothetical protein
MSEYGRLWEEVECLRRALLILLPNTSAGSLAIARKAADDHEREVAQLLRKWADLEQRMAQMRE